MMSSTINDAYRTLKSPIDRAAYLLKSQNIDADAPEHTSFSPEFLMQQMEWRETLMDAQMEQKPDAIRALDQEIKKFKATYIKICNKHLNNRIMNQPHNGYGMDAFLIKLRNEIASIL